MKHLNKSTIIFIIVCVVLGFLSGVVGELWLNSFLLPDPYLSFKSYSDLSKKLNELVSSQNDRKLDRQDALVDEMVRNVRGAVVGIYKYKKFSADSTTTLLPDDWLGQGIVITNDGWLLSSSSGVKNDKVKYWVAFNNGQILATEKIVNDKETGATFLKVDGTGLPVAEFTLRENLAEGQQVFSLGARNSVVKYNIENSNYAKLTGPEDYIHESERFYKYILLDENVSRQEISNPAVTNTGAVIGLVKSEDGLIIPMNHLIGQMKKVIKGETWARPYLGVSFYDLSEMLSPEIKETKGAMILKSKGVKVDSPALNSLLAGDIILKVENEELNASKNLPDILATYQANDKIKLTIKRAGEQKEVEVKLGKKN